jgi:cyclopropane fatty-acyl-phospholipid synthase-like methyltransferase
MSTDFFEALAQVERLPTGRRRGDRFFAVREVFRGLDVRDRTVLDVGGGAGSLSFYAAALGAREVVCLEPAAAGSAGDIRARFEHLGALTGLADRVRHDPSPIQTYTPSHTFDLVLSQNSINHMDERACIDLHRSPEARARYQHIFSRLAALTSPGGHLVMSDCSSNAVWPKLGVRSPLAPKMAWHKHQPPEVWSALATEAGFRLESLQWSTPRSLRSVGRTLLSNRAVAWLTTAHFVLRFTR